MFRLGELVMAFSALIFLITLIIFKPIYEEKYKSIFLTSILVLLTFGMTVVFTGSNLFNVYTYKASSYIWSIGFLFLGLTFKAQNPQKAILNLITNFFINNISCRNI